MPRHVRADTDTPPPAGSPADPSATPSRGRVPGWIIVGALVVLGVAVRWPQLSAGLWYDEIAAWRDYGAHGVVAALTTYHDPANHVAHTALTALSVAWLGGLIDDTTALRVPALLFSLAAIPALFLLGRAATGRPAAIVAAGLAAAAPVAVLEGTEARGYSMMMCAAALATWAMTRLLDARGRRWVGWAALYAATVTLGIWAHFMTVFVLFGHGLWLAGHALFARDGRSLARGATALSAGAGLTLLALSPILSDVAHVRATIGSGHDAVLSPFGREGRDTLLQLGGAWIWWAALPGLALAALGFTSAMRDARARRAVALALLGLPILVVFVLAADTWMYARFALFTVPGGLLLIAIGLERVRTWRRPVWMAALVALAAAYALDLALRPPKQPLREAAAYVRARYSPGDRLLIVGLRHRVMDVYADDLAPTYSLFHGADLDEQLTATDPDWALILYPAHVTPERRAMLRAHGLQPQSTLPGWVDGGNGAVEVWGRRRGTEAHRH